MSEQDYAVVSLDEATWSTTPDGVRHAPLTAALGATETAVDAYRVQAAGTFRPPVALENLLVPLDASEPLAVTGSTGVPARGLGRVPAGVEATVQCEAATVLVVSAPAEATPGEAPTAEDLEGCEYAVPSTSDVATAFLTGPLGCAGMKANARLLEPGQTVPYHTEGDQEELFVPLRGPATMRIDGDTHRLSSGTVARVAPPTPRSAVNDGDADALWVMVGAPPTGGPTGWDPGAEVVD